jgi:transcriptional regulator with XRE-family HTH domain
MRKKKRRDKASAVDAVVGGRIRLRRQALGLSEMQLGKGVGLSHQQIAKYEKSENRVGAGRLYDIAAQLGVPVSFFFHGAAGAPTTSVAGQLEADLGRISGEAAAFVKALARVRDPKVRQRLAALIRALGVEK